VRNQILFLNKHDIFSQKIAHSDIKNFPDYEGEPGNVPAGLNYFKKRFTHLAQNAGRSQPHATSASTSMFMSAAVPVAGAGTESALLHELAIQQIGGIPCYVSKPTGTHAAEKAVLFLMDISGLALYNKASSSPLSSRLCTEHLLCSCARAYARLQAHGLIRTPAAGF
jgi:hypothetical protein